MWISNVFSAPLQQAIMVTAGRHRIGQRWYTSQRQSSLFPQHVRCQCNGHACLEMTVAILNSSKHHYTAGSMWSLAGHCSTTKVTASFHLDSSLNTQLSVAAVTPTGYSALWSVLINKKTKWRLVAQKAVVLACRGLSASLSLVDLVGKPSKCNDL